MDAFNLLFAPQTNDLIETDCPDDSSVSEDEGAVFDVPSVQADPLTSSYTYHSPLPSALANNRGEPCILGVDEAGRGPVLGPMVYCICYCPLSRYEQVSKLGFVDSKTLKESHRESHFRLIQSHQENIAWSVRVLSPQDISWNMLKMNKYNLNAQAHDTTIELIRQVLIKGVNVTEIYIDTVGPPESYKAKLSKIFPGIKITVEKKADSKYPIVSAASICAKVTRDQVLKHWTFVEKELKSSKIFGSGYPSDPNTKLWLTNNMDPVFGFPRVMRFSWATCENLLKDRAVTIIWYHST
ncbi:ribonuclease H-like domain-containing protein [Gigaspora rosea]|uniref:Ribonuclease n=1 Tax=Gigaspora rosea TaxID=44941 RepID=A0A397UKX0_9GLOM|nr:ribonuclease H-like domain-containing protein [Gigaspora rosea]